MPRYRLLYCEIREFEAQTAGEVVPFIAVDHMMGGESEPKLEEIYQEPVQLRLI